MPTIAFQPSPCARPARGTARSTRRRGSLRPRRGRGPRCRRARACRAAKSHRSAAGAAAATNAARQAEDRAQRYRRAARLHAVDHCRLRLRCASSAPCLPACRRCGAITPVTVARTEPRATRASICAPGASTDRIGHDVACGVGDDGVTAIERGERTHRVQRAHRALQALARRLQPALHRRGQAAPRDGQALPQRLEPASRAAAPEQGLGVAQPHARTLESRRTARCRRCSSSSRRCACWCRRARGDSWFSDRSHCCTASAQRSELAPHRLLQCCARARAARAGIPRCRARSARRRRTAWARVRRRRNRRS